MMYLGYVQGGKTTLAEGEFNEEKDQQERILNQFYVEREIKAMGVECWLPRKIEFKRVGNNRRASPFEKPYLPNYIFIDMCHERFLDVLGIKYLSSTLMMLSRADIRALTPFRAEIDGEYAKQQKAAENQEAICEYVKGEKLRMMDARFGDQAATFVAMVERAHDLYPKIKAEFEMMGQTVTAELDPLSVRAAE